MAEGSAIDVSDVGPDKTYKTVADKIAAMEGKYADRVDTASKESLTPGGLPEGTDPKPFTTGG